MIWTMKVKITPTKEIQLLGLDERSIGNLFWCAMSYRMDRLFWVDGYLLCLENCEDAMNYEIDKGFFPISQVCYSKFPKYAKYHEVEKGLQIPIVNVSDMEFYREIVKAIKNKESSVSTETGSQLSS